MKLTEHLEHKLRFQKENCWQILVLLFLNCMVVLSYYSSAL